MSHQGVPRYCVNSQFVDTEGLQYLLQHYIWAAFNVPWILADPPPPVRGCFYRDLTPLSNLCSFKFISKTGDLCSNNLKLVSLKQYFSIIFWYRFQIVLFDIYYFCIQGNLAILNYELFAFVLILNDRPSHMMTDYIFSCLSVILNYGKNSASQHSLCQVLTCTIVLSLTQNYCPRDLAYRSPGVWSFAGENKNRLSHFEMFSINEPFLWLCVAGSLKALYYIKPYLPSLNMV